MIATSGFLTHLECTRFDFGRGSAPDPAWGHDTSKTAKINFINSGASDIIRTAYYIRGLELMKLIFAVLDVSLTMGLTRCYKTEGFFTFISYRIFDRCAFTGQLLYCVLNFDRSAPIWVKPDGFD